MHAILLLTVLALSLPLASSSSRFLSIERAGRRVSHPELEELKNRANALAKRHLYVEASVVYNSGLVKSQEMNDPRMVLRFLIGLGNCALVGYEYRKALDFYLSARTHAIELRDWATASDVSENLSTLYRFMNDFPSAMAAVSESMEFAARTRSKPARASLLLNAAILRGRLGDAAQAMTLFRQGIETASLVGDAALLADAWELFGFELYRTRQYERADHALTESFRIRKLLSSPGLANSLRYLAMLRVAQGDPCTALNLINESIRTAALTRITFRPYSLYYERGRALAQCGQPAHALTSFEKSIDLARQWRPGVLPADSFRIGVDENLQEIFSAYLETGVRLHRKTRSAALLRRLLTAAEENRAASLRAFVPTDRPAEYWKALSELRAAEIASFVHTPGAEERASVLRVRLSEIEAQTAPLESRVLGSNRPPAESLQSLLESNEAFLSFHLGDKESYLWVLTSSGIEMHVRPARKVLAEAIQRFRTSIEKHNVTHGGAQLYDLLFSDTSPEALARPDWILSLDGELFELPFAALIPSGTKSPEFLIERHSIRTIPSLRTLASRTSSGPRANNDFFGIGDPVLNGADPRWKGGRVADSTIQFARLPATLSELRSAAGGWDSRPHFLTGLDTQRASVYAALQRNPAIAHFATHVVENPSARDRAMIALGLKADGEADFLTAVEIASLRANVGLVTLSGCASGRGKSLRGAGLIGLTRAWLAGGTGAVAATYWPLRDGTGPLFGAFYESLKAETRDGFSAAAAARALQTAQLQLLRSPAYQGQPDLWAAFFITGRD